MKIEKVMTPLSSGAVDSRGIKYYKDLYSISLKEIECFEKSVPIIDDNDQVIGEVDYKLISDILVERASSYLHEALDTLESGVAIVGVSERILYMNEPYAKYLGYPIPKALGRIFSEINPNAQVLSVLKTKEPAFYEMLYVEKTDIYITGRISPIYVDNVFSGVVTSFSDVTMQDKLHSKYEHASQVARDLQKLISERSKIKALNIVGDSPTFQTALNTALVVADTDAPALIIGESGSGKEMIARLIHESGSRKGKPFIVVNCSAIPENLIESELFGYEPGAFTGANAKGKLGKFELADGGTLFLDEIGDMSLMMQPKMLRVLQENEIEKIGAEKKKSVDVRIISATNQPLEVMIESKEFREDLFYRINTVTINVPPLRDRKEDIIVMLNAFLGKYNEKYKKNVKFSYNAYAILNEYHWPGNVRELKNFVEHSIIMANENEVVESNDILKEMKAQLGYNVSDYPMISPVQNEEYLFDDRELNEIIAEVEKKVLIDALKKNNNNKSKTMDKLGLSRRTFYRKIQKHNIEF